MKGLWNTAGFYGGKDDGNVVMKQCTHIRSLSYSLNPLVDSAARRRGINSVVEIELEYCEVVVYLESG